MTLSIRPECAADHDAISDVTRRAFAPMPYAGGDEHGLIGRFRDAGVLALSLVADIDGRVVGQVSFTPAAAADGSGGWFALGPVAVDPDLQGRGIGAALIGAGIDWLRSRDAAGCVLVGNPAYYRRFGFRAAPHLCPEGEPAEYYQVLLLGKTEAKAVVDFHPLFHDSAAVTVTP